MWFGSPNLGRGVILLPGQEKPSHFDDAAEVSIEAPTLQAPNQTVELLSAQWASLQPVVVRLAIEAGELKKAAMQVVQSPVWSQSADLQLWLQRLHFLVWNNNWDMRSGEPVWWWARKAQGLGASVADGEEFDIFLPDGRPAVCHGGPQGWIDIDVALVSYVAIEAGSLRPWSPASAGGDLADDQQAAVDHGYGPARIVAPAGSGKTRVLAARLQRIMSQGGIESSGVMAVAYNTRAAHELSQRVNHPSATVRTLNSLALAIVNGTGGFRRSELVPQPRSVLNERDVRSILRTIVDVPRKANVDPFASWIEALSALRLGLVSPEEIESDWDDLSDVGRCFEEYREALQARHVVDFDEQIYLAIEILLRDPDARAVAQRRCRMMLVDEFQDLTPAHVLLIRLLSAPAFDVFGVGDDDQVIYGYSGAQPAFLVQFDKWFPHAAHYLLHTNYRCPPAVVEAANNLLTRNPNRITKQIRPGKSVVDAKAGLDVKLVGGQFMAPEVLKIIEKWRREASSYDSMAVLSRVNVSLLPVQVLLSTAGVPHSSPVDASVLERTGLRTALAYLRMACEPQHLHRADIAETVRRPSRKIARNVVEMMTRRPENSLLGLKSLARALSGHDAERVQEYASQLGHLAALAQPGSTVEVLHAVRDHVGLGETMEVLDSSRRHVDRSAHGDDLAALAALAHLQPDVRLFEQWLRDVLSQPGHANGVELSTVHKVKGREWPHVVVYGADADLMPHRLAADRAEERRVFHVAITRGIDDVVVVADSDRPSSFLAEIRQPGPVDRPPTRPVVAEAQSRSAIDPAAPGVPASPMFVALKQWRHDVARQAGVPAYRVLHDSHLESIASSQPTSLAQLSKCRGMGATKLERWGDEILAVVAEGAGK